MKKMQVLTAVVILALAGSGRALAEDGPQESREALGLFLQADPGLQEFLKSAAGYAVFPAVTKGAIGIGAAHGGGCVYERGAMVGTTSLTQVTLGLALGGQSFAEVIFFQTPEALDSFKKSELTLSAQVSAVAAASGASNNAISEACNMAWPRARMRASDSGRGRPSTTSRQSRSGGRAAALWKEENGRPAASWISSARSVRCGSVAAMRAA